MPLLLRLEIAFGSSISKSLNIRVSPKYSRLPHCNKRHNHYWQSIGTERYSRNHDSASTAQAGSLGNQSHIFNQNPLLELAKQASQKGSQSFHINAIGGSLSARCPLPLLNLLWTTRIGLSQGPSLMPLYTRSTAHAISLGGSASTYPRL